MTLISIVAPVFNEEENVEEFVKRVSEEVKNITQDYKIILIDDGSVDNTWKKIEKLTINSEKIKAIKFSRNFGHHRAISAGLHSANSDWVIVMDSDLQDRPEVIPQLYHKAIEGFDVVFVNRTDRPESFLYRISQKIFYLILNICSGIKFNSQQANFSIISRKVVAAFNKFPEQSRFYGSTVLWLGFKRTQISARHGIRFRGKPSYNLKKRFKLASEIILAFSDRPLKFTVYLGLGISFVSLFLAIYMLLNIFIQDELVSNWIIITNFCFLIGGIQISILGIIGIYISKVFEEVKKRPLYIVEKIMN